MSFRIIVGVIKSQFSKQRASGVFGSPKGLHNTPRRFKYFSNAVESALKRGLGVYEIHTDNNDLVGVVRDGKLMGTHPDYIYVPLRK